MAFWCCSLPLTVFFTLVLTHAPHPDVRTTRPNKKEEKNVNFPEINLFFHMWGPGESVTQSKTIKGIAFSALFLPSEVEARRIYFHP